MKYFEKNDDNLCQMSHHSKVTFFTATTDDDGGDGLFCSVQ